MREAGQLHVGGMLSVQEACSPYGRRTFCVGGVLSMWELCSLFESSRDPLIFWLWDRIADPGVSMMSWRGTAPSLGKGPLHYWRELSAENEVKLRK